MNKEEKNLPWDKRRKEIDSSVIKTSPNNQLLLVKTNKFKMCTMFLSCRQFHSQRGDARSHDRNFPCACKQCNFKLAG